MRKQIELESQQFFGLRGLRCGCPKVTTGGQARAADPATTLRNIRPFFKQAGLTRLGNITYLDRHDLPVTVAVRPNSKSLSVSSGKAAHLEAALVSGAMEALELYAAEEAPPPVLTCPYNRLETDRIPFDLLPLRKRATFRDSDAVGWNLGWDLMNQREVSVPHEWMNMSLCLPAVRESFSPFRLDSNGLASGSHPLEAICSALLELVERDAVTLRTYAGDLLTGSRGVNLETLASPHLRQIVERVRRSGLEVALFDSTSDLGIPTYQAFCCDRTLPRLTGAGYGAHLDPEVAAERALLEALQSRTVIIAGARDDVTKSTYRVSAFNNGRDFFHTVLQRAPVLDLPVCSQATASFEGDIAVILERLRRAGLQQTIVVDLTPAGWPVSVFRALVPGLEGYYPTNRPGPRARALGRPLVEGGENDSPVHLPAGGG